MTVSACVSACGESASLSGGQVPECVLRPLWGAIGSKGARWASAELAARCGRLLLRLQACCGLAAACAVGLEAAALLEAGARCVRLLLRSPADCGLAAACGVGLEGAALLEATALLEAGERGVGVGWVEEEESTASLGRRRRELGRSQLGRGRLPCPCSLLPSLTLSSGPWRRADPADRFEQVECVWTC